MVGQAHARLRDATRDDHERLESRLDVLSRLGRPAGRRELLVRFWRLHAGAEAAIEPWLAEVLDLDFEARRRTAVLCRDLAHLSLPATEPADAGLSVRSRSEALGVMYVLEGSTLGGKVIRRQVEAGGGQMAGLEFLDPYGPQGGERWRSFLAVLDREAPDVEALIRGALAGFRYAELTLCGEAAPAR